VNKQSSVVDKEAAVADITNVLSKFTSYIGKRLPTDVTTKLGELRSKEVNFLAKEVFESMRENQELADKLDRPSCQGATKEGPLRHNAVETFEEKNTGTNTGSKIPWLDWEIIPGADHCIVDVYMAGGGCTLPGAAKVLMPGQGYEGVAEFVFDVITSRGVNACPPLLVGVGVSTSAETAARLSKKAILRPVTSSHPNENAAMMEELLTDGLNELGLGPQGLTGANSVMGVNIESSARHPSTIGVAVSTGCWAHRRGKIKINADMSYEVISHEGFKL
jgi:L(+)-tartrate dehydratase alpha subunit